MVPTEGVEPTQPCGYWILSPARLPIPPHRPPRSVTVSNRPFPPQAHSQPVFGRKRRFLRGGSASVIPTTGLMGKDLHFLIKHVIMRFNLIQRHIPSVGTTWGLLESSVCG